MHNNIKQRFGTILSYIFLVTVFLFTVAPLLYTLFSSFKSNAELLTGGVNLLPKKWHFENYVIAFREAGFLDFTLNSVFITFFIVIGSIITASICGYVFSRGEFPGKRLLIGLFVFSMFLSIGAVSLYPQLLVARALHLNQSLWGIIFIRVVGINIAQFFLSIGYINTIPKELDQSAAIDGCSFFGIYWRIIMPNASPLIATIGLIAFRNGWNEYLLPLVFSFNRPELQTLIVGVVNLRTSGMESLTPWNLMLAGSSIALAPIIIVYLFLNKYFTSGLMSGAVKG
ncbi:MAG: carbohydrate ABC transporter permease [Bacteroidales bacterium]|nr:carbohydrate ABC transporter permease [Bacteroidales bacterium]